MRRICIAVLFGMFLFIAGCKTAAIIPKDVVLLPEDRIYTVPAGQKIHLILDKNDLGELVFPYDMKLVHESILERNEQQLNDIALKKVKADQDANKRTGIVSSIVGFLAAVAGVVLKTAWTKKQEKK